VGSGKEANWIRTLPGKGWFADSVRVARYIFPAWVFVVSVYILVLNYRRTQNQEPEAT
jgi:hypothetical protein